jgi:hypothetical protein
VIAFFPTPLPDELLYSVCAEYQALMGYPSDQSASCDLFGRALSPAIALPGHLATLLSRLPPGHMYSLETLAQAHTLAPYATAMLAPTKAADVVQGLAGAARGTHRRAAACSRGSRGVAERLRACAACMAEDFSRYGRAYWHRAHQLPGVLVCSTHAEWLNDTRCSADARGSREDRFRWHRATPAMMAGRLAPADVDFATALDIALGSDEILKCRIGSEGPEHKRARLREVATAAGWTGQNGRLRRVEFDLAVARHFGEPLLQLVGCAVPSRGPGWPSSVLAWGRSPEYPLRYVLVASFLRAHRPARAESTCIRQGGSAPRVAHRVSAVGATLAPQDVVATATAPCRNPTCARFAREAPLVAPAAPRADGYVAWETVKCTECLFTYRFNRASPTHWRLIATGEKWDAELVGRVRALQGSQKEVAKELGVGIHRFVLERRRLGACRPEWDRKLGVTRKRPVSRSIAATRKLNRERLKSAMRGSPGASRSALHRLCPSYNWLIKNDRAWLERRLPRARRGAEGRVLDWSSRDDALADTVRITAAELRQAAFPRQRVSRVVIARSFGSRQLANDARVFLTRLPKTRAVLSDCVEDWHSYLNSKLQWAARQIVVGPTLPPLGSIVRRAGFSNLSRASRYGDVQAIAEAVLAERESARVPEAPRLA